MLFGRRNAVRVGQDQAVGWPEREPPGGTNPGHRRRLLVESEDGAEAVAIWKLLERRGIDVSWCPGPDARRSSRCPLVHTGSCRLVDQADAVLCALDLEDPKQRAVLEALNTAHPEKPVVVAASSGAQRRWRRLLAERRTLRRGPQPMELVTSVEDALAG